MTRRCVSYWIAATCALALAVPGWAAEGTEHEHNHEAAVSLKPTETPAADTRNVMKDMQAMHQKMMAAKTTAERQALMAEHIRAMQAGMKSMQQMMNSDHEAKTGDAMKPRMDMMTMMMQLMMDREVMGGSPASPSPSGPAAK